MKTYLIYDGEETYIFAPDIIIEAKTGKEAIEKHLAKTGRKYLLRRSAKDDVKFKAEPFYEENGKRYKNGNVVWYAIVD